MTDNRQQWIFNWQLLQIEDDLYLLGLDPPRPDSPTSPPQPASVQIFSNGSELAPDTPSLSNLLAQVRDTDREARREAILKLGHLRDIRAVPDLLTALTDSEWPVRLAAVWSLGQMADKVGDIRALPGLAAMLQEEEWLLRRTAAWAIGRLHDRRTLSPLIDHLADRYSPVREAIAWALGEIGDTVGTDGVGMLLDDPSVEVRQQAIDSLIRLGGMEAQMALMRLFATGGGQEADRVVVALGKVGNEEVLPSLVTAMRDPRKEVRYAAAQAMGYLGDGRALSALLSALHSNDVEMRKAAAAGLGLLGVRAGSPAVGASAYHALQDRWSNTEIAADERDAYGRAMARVHEAQINARQSVKKLEQQRNQKD